MKSIVCRFMMAYLLFIQGLQSGEAVGRTILLTGGTGYIGSHLAVVLLQNDCRVVIVDNLSNSERSVIDGIEAAANRMITAFYQCDLTDHECLRNVFDEHKIDAVVHLAGYKSVSESVKTPLAYYQNNLCSTLNLLEVMKEYGCHKLIFSSSATVYGAPEYLPIDENHPVNASNPYGRTKLMIEEILQDMAAADPLDQFISLRYFNPVGAHPSGLIGEMPAGVPLNLMPYILQVVQGRRPCLIVYGDDYNTPDGTAIRDYIHVMDLAEGHFLALNTLFTDEPARPSYRVYNLGTGAGYSVKQIIDAVSVALGYLLPYEMSARRPGDVEELVANPIKAEKELGFTATRTLDQMVLDSLNWNANSLLNSSK